MKKVFFICLSLVCALILVTYQIGEVGEARAIRIANFYAKSHWGSFDSFGNVGAEQRDLGNRTYTVIRGDVTNEISNKNVWIVSYCYEGSSMLGSYTVYVDRNSGKVYGNGISF
jgi:hypothetical protein